MFWNNKLYIIMLNILRLILKKISRNDVKSLLKKINIKYRNFYYKMIKICYYLKLFKN